MEITKIGSALSGIFLKEPLPFTKRRDINWKVIRTSLIVGLCFMVVVILILPPPQKVQKNFYEKSDGRQPANETKTEKVPHENNPTEDALAQLQNAKGQASSVPRSLDYLNSGTPQMIGVGGSKQNLNSTMILQRGGLDARMQLASGTKFSVTLDSSLTLDNRSVPIIATVSSEVVQESGTAIPQGSKLYGDANFDDGSERVQVNWKSVQFPNGQMKPLTGMAVGSDGQVGIEGTVHSNALKNSMGQTITRFIGSYAEGSMQRGALGSNPGGDNNGMKNAIAETAKDQANNWAENLKKEKKWIELKAGTQSIAVLTQAFQFKDPGGTYGN